MSIITIEQQIEELRLELKHSDLTKQERAEAIAELAWLKEQLRIEAETEYFAAIEREVEERPRQAIEVAELPF
jgi:hypothetical protein